MRLLAAATLLACTPTAVAAELYCEGESFSGEIAARSSIVFTLDAENAWANVETHSGIAEGPIQVTSRLYVGTLRTPSGVNYWFNLNRFTGELILGPMSSEPRMDRIEFSGVCNERHRKF